MMVEARMSAVLMRRPKPIPLETLESAAAVLRVLAHPQRLRMVELLLDGPRAVGQLAQAVGLAPAAVSQHLNNMRAHGIVDCHRVGHQVHYQVVNANAKQLIKCLRQYGDGCGLMRGSERAGR
jgi:DNA-binding transcriptional ArsR family regulator